MRRSPFALLVCVAALLGAVSCGREIVGPHGARAGAVQLAPTFPSVQLAGQDQPLNLGSIVSFTRVRVVLLRANGDTVADRVVDFPADSASISLAFTVALDQSAPATGEVLSASIRLIAASGDTVFRGGPVQVVAAPTTAAPPAPAEIPLTYSGPGASAASIVVSPRTRAARVTEVIPFTATVRDAQGATLANTPVAYTSLDTTKVRVGLSTGSALVTGFRGSAVVVAQTLTGQRDTAVVTIVPTPTAIAVVAGNNQQVEQQFVFPTPVRVRVSAGDGLPVAGEVLAFTVTSGLGTVSQARDTTDAQGVAEVVWTAGALTGAATLRAEVIGAPTTVAVVANGTQLAPPPPAQLRFVQQPSAITAGDTLPTLSVVLLTAAGDTARTYSGPIRMTVGAGPSGGTLGGTTTVAASNGTARFSGLRLTLAGADYRLVARADSVAGVASAPTDTFTVRSGPATTLRLTGRAAQVAGDTQTVRVTALDAFGNVATAFAGPFSLVVNECQGTATGEVVTGQTPVAWNGSTTVAFAAGVADIVIRPFTAGTYDLCAGILSTTVTSVAGQRLALTVAPAAASHFRLTAPTAWTAGVSQPVTVTGYDDYENVATGLTSLIRSVQFSGPSNAPDGSVPTMVFVGGTAVPFTNNASLAFTNGVATSLLTLVASESTTLAATSGTITTRAADVVAVSVVAGATQRLAFTTALAGATNGTAFVTQPVLRAADAFGNATGQGGLVVTAAIASGTGTLGGTLTRTTVAGSGTATFTDLGITGAGTHTVRFSTTGGLTAAVSDPVIVASVAPGIRLHAGASDRTSATVGTDVAIPLLLDLSNRNGDDLASLTATVTWDTTQFSYVGTTAGAWVDDAGGSASVFLNTTATAAGQLALNGFTANATTSSFVFRTLTLRPRTAGTATVTVTAGASGNAAGGAITVVARPLAITISP